MPRGDDDDVRSVFFQECPSGAVTEREFQSIYSHFFPHGNCQTYTSFLFRILDRRKRMYFTFEVIHRFIERKEAFPSNCLGLYSNTFGVSTRNTQGKTAVDLSIL